MPDISGRAQSGRRKPTVCFAREKVHSYVRPPPWSSRASAFSGLGFRCTSWPSPALYHPAATWCPTPWTHISREASGLAGAEGLATVEASPQVCGSDLFLEPRTALWRRSGDGHTPPSSTENLLCDFGQESLPLRILTSPILNRKYHLRLL